MYEIWRKSSDKQLSKNVHKCKIGQAFDKSDPYVKIVSEYDQEIPQSQTADNPVAPRGRAKIWKHPGDK